MIRLTKALNAWGTPEFEAALKQEIEQLDAAQLPLQQGLTTGSYALAGHKAMLISTSEDAGVIRVKAGIFLFRHPYRMRLRRRPHPRQ